jgi:hypothetical protein
LVGSLAAVALTVLPARAETPKPVEPAVIVRLKSFDGLLADAKYLAELAGQQDKAREVEGIVQALAGPKGLAGTGIDTKRPFALYGVVGQAGVDSKVVLMVPVTDENVFAQAATDHLGRFNVTIKKGDDGVYTVSVPNAPVEAYFRVVNGYAYIAAPDRTAVEGANVPHPSRIVSSDSPDLISATVHIDRIPDMVKQVALQQLQLQAANAKEKKEPNETPAQTRFKEQAVDLILETFSSVVTDGAAFDLNLAIDRRAEEASFQMALTGKPGSNLAKHIAGLARRESRFGGLAADALKLSVNLAVPPSLRDAFAAVVDEGLEEAINKESDPAKQAAARRLLPTLAPTFKAGSLDLVVGLRGPDAAGHYVFVGGIKVTDGLAIERAVKELAAKMPENERTALKLDAMTVGGVSVHRVDPGDKVDEQGRRLFGDRPAALVAFRPDAVVGVIGGDGAAGALKALIESRPAPANALYELAISFARIAAIPDVARPAAARDAAREVFGADPGGRDMFRSSIAGGDALRVRAAVKTQVITFGAKISDKADK